MAGIGFTLRKLAAQDNLIGLVRASVHSAFASTGPWLCTVIALGLLMAVSERITSTDLIFEFRAIIVYNFCFSLVFSAPIFMVITRYLADAIHRKNVTTAPGVLLGGLMLAYGIQLPIATAFYFGVTTLSAETALCTVLNFMLVTSIWIVSVFLTALKDYRTVSYAFVGGTVIAIIAAGFLGEYYGLIGLINGFSIGLALTFFTLMARVFSEYPYRLRKPFAYLGYFRRYWELAAAGFLYNIAVWVDKWIMWFAPERERLDSGLILHSHYDSAMFLAFLTIVPAMAMFVLSIETRFFIHYLQFYRDILNQAAFRRIQANHKALQESTLLSARNFLILQGSLILILLLYASPILEAIKYSALQLGIFRYGILGAFFHTMMLFLTIILSYFDCRKAPLVIYGIFLVTNMAGTWIGLQLGFPYYGTGYAFASVVSFSVAATYTVGYIRKLPYHTFITTNPAVRAVRQGATL
jgi:uncharacterized membrane protein